jgi:Adaptin C-terminal domain
VLDAAAAAAPPLDTPACDLLGDLAAASEAEGGAARPSGDGGGGEAAAADPLADLDALLATPAPSAAPSAGAPQAAGPAGGGGLDDLLGGPAAVAQAAAGAGAATFVAWSEGTDGVEVSFAVEARGAGEAAIAATYSCFGSAALDGFQVRVPTGCAWTMNVWLTLRVSLQLLPGCVQGFCQCSCEAVLDACVTARARRVQVLAAVPKSMSVRMQPQLGGRRLEPRRGNALTQVMAVVNNSGGAKPLAMRLKVSYEVGGQRREHLAVASGFPPGL